MEKRRQGNETSTRQLFPAVFPNMPSHAPTKIWLLCLMAVLVAMVVSSLGLEEAEKAALSEIYTGFPSLAHISTIDQYPDAYNTSINMGASWNGDFSATCTSGSGWELFGLHCSDTGHIDAIRVTDAWGVPASRSFVGISGLTHLRSYTSELRNVQDIDQELFRAILGSPAISLGSITAGAMAPIDMITNHTSLTYLNLTGIDEPISFSDLTNLQYLYLEHARGDLVYLVHTLNSLKEARLHYDWFVPATFLDLLSLPNIEAVTARTRLVGSIGIFIPQTTIVKSLSLSLGNQTAITVHRSAPLQKLDVSGPLPFTISTLPSSLRHLKVGPTCTKFTSAMLPFNVTHFELGGSALTQLPDISTMANLLSLTLKGVNDSVLQTATSLVETTLETLAFVDCNPTNATFQTIVCSAISTLRNLTVKGKYDTSTPYLQVPSCLASSQLTSLSFTSTNLEPDFISKIPSTLTSFELSLLDGTVTFPSRSVGWSSLGSRLPLLTTLIIVNGQLSESLTASWGSRFSNLEKLVLTNNVFSNSIPTTWPARMPKLKYVDLSENQLPGFVPSYATQNWEYVDFRRNVLQGWYSLPLTDEPKYRYINLYGNLMQFMPSDEAFRQMKHLQFLDLSRNSLNVGLPTFWHNSTSLVHLDMSSNLAIVPLPESITAPYLRVLNFAPSRVCGDLPSIPSEIGLTHFAVTGSTYLNGTIPDSWRRNLTILHRLSLHNNNLTGSLNAPHFLNERSRRSVQMVDLARNRFEGPMFDWSQFRNASTVIAHTTNLDLCATDPNIPGGEFSCDVTSIPEGTCACDLFYHLCRKDDCTPTGEVTPFSVTQVLPVTPIQCKYRSHSTLGQVPIPQCNTPPPGFVCLGGEIVYMGDFNASTSIEFAPNLGVVTIDGNLTTTEPLIFLGLGTTLDVQGCANVTQIRVQLPEDYSTTTSPPTTLLKQGANCPNRLAETILVSSSDPCAQVSVSTRNTQTSLVAIFQLTNICNKNRSESNTRWIILGSVLGAVVLILLILILIFTLNSKARNCVRPFYQRTARRKSTV